MLITVRELLADRHPPHLCQDRPAAGVDLHHNWLVVHIERRSDRQVLLPREDVFLMLVAIDVELLPEVALLVEEPNGNHTGG